VRQVHFVNSFPAPRAALSLYVYRFMVTLRRPEIWIYIFPNVGKAVGNVENLCVHEPFILFPAE
jgi:hypothetical protein